MPKVVFSFLFIGLCISHIQASINSYTWFNQPNGWDYGVYDLVVAVEDEAIGDDNPREDVQCPAYSAQSKPQGDCMQQYIEAVIRDFALNIFEVTNGAHSIGNVAIFREKDLPKDKPIDILFFTSADRGSDYQEQSCPNNDCSACTATYGANVKGFNGKCVENAFRSYASMGGISFDNRHSIGIHQSLFNNNIIEGDDYFRFQQPQVTARVLIHEFMHYAYGLDDTYYKGEFGYSVETPNVDKQCPTGLIYPQSTERVFPDIMFDAYINRDRAVLLGEQLKWEYNQCGLSLTASESQFDLPAPLQGKRCSWNLAGKRSGWETISSYSGGINPSYLSYPMLAKFRPTSVDYCDDGEFGVKQYTRKLIKSDNFKKRALSKLNMTWNSVWNPPERSELSPYSTYTIWAIVPTGLKNSNSNTDEDRAFALHVIQSAQIVNEMQPVYDHEYGIIYHSANTIGYSIIDNRSSMNPEIVGTSDPHQPKKTLPGFTSILNETNMSVVGASTPEVFFSAIATHINKKLNEHARVELNLIYPNYQTGSLAEAHEKLKKSLFTNRLIVNGISRADSSAKPFHRSESYLQIGDWHNYAIIINYGSRFIRNISSSNFSNDLSTYQSYRGITKVNNSISIPDSFKAVHHSTTFQTNQSTIFALIRVTGELASSKVEHLVVTDQNNNPIQCEIIDHGTNDRVQFPYLFCQAKGIITKLTFQSTDGQLDNNFGADVVTYLSSPLVYSSIQAANAYVFPNTIAPLQKIDAHLSPVMIQLTHNSRPISGAQISYASEFVDKFVTQLNDEGVWPDMNPHDGFYTGLLDNENSDEQLTIPVKFTITDTTYYVKPADIGSSDDVEYVQEHGVLTYSLTSSSPADSLISEGCREVIVPSLNTSEGFIASLQPNECINVIPSDLTNFEINGPGLSDLSLTSCNECKFNEGYGLNFKTKGSFSLQNGAGVKNAVVAIAAYPSDSTFTQPQPFQLKQESNNGEQYLRVRGRLQSFPTENAQISFRVNNPSALDLDEMSLWYKGPCVKSIANHSMTNYSQVTVSFDKCEAEWQSEFLIGFRGKNWESLNLSVDNLVPFQWIQY